MLKLGDGGEGGITSVFNPLSSLITFCQEIIVPTASAYIWDKEDDLYHFMDWLSNLGGKKARRLFNSRLLLSLNLEAIVMLNYCKLINLCTKNNHHTANQKMQANFVIIANNQSKLWCAMVRTKRQSKDDKRWQRIEQKRAGFQGLSNVHNQSFPLCKCATFSQLELVPSQVRSKNSTPICKIQIQRTYKYE